MVVLPSFANALLLAYRTTHQPPVLPEQPQLTLHEVSALNKPVARPFPPTRLVYAMTLLWRLRGTHCSVLETFNADSTCRRRKW